MSITNHIIIIIGAIVILIGILSIFFPALTKIINAPGGERLKSITAIIIGIILIIIGFIVNFQKN